MMTWIVKTQIEKITIKMNILKNKKVLETKVKEMDMLATHLKEEEVMINTERMMTLIVTDTTVKTEKTEQPMKTTKKWKMRMK